MGRLRLVANPIDIRGKLPQEQARCSLSLSLSLYSEDRSERLRTVTESDENALFSAPQSRLVLGGKDSHRLILIRGEIFSLRLIMQYNPALTRA